MDAPHLASPQIDTAIAELFIDQDPGGMQQLLEVYGDAVKRVLWMKIGPGSGRRTKLPEDQIEDVILDATLKYWRAPDAYDERQGGLRNWFIQVALNCARDRLRREERMTPLTDELVTQTEPTSEPQSGREKAKQKKIRAALEEAMIGLTKTERALIERDLELGGAASPTLLAAELGLTINSVGAHRSRARKKLRDALEAKKLI